MESTELLVAFNLSEFIFRALIDIVTMVILVGFIYYPKYKNKDFEIVSISIDTFGDNWAKAIEKDGLTWVNLIEIGGWHGKVTNQFEIKGIPLNILLDKDGKIIAVNSTRELLLKKLDFLLK